MAPHVAVSPGPQAKICDPLPLKNPRPAPPKPATSCPEFCPPNALENRILSAAEYNAGPGPSTTFFMRMEGATTALRLPNRRRSGFFSLSGRQSANEKNPTDTRIQKVTAWNTRG